MPELEPLADKTPAAPKYRPFIRGRSQSLTVSDYEDDVWDVAAITHANNVRHCDIKFAEIFDSHWIAKGRQLGYALLNERIEPRAKRVKPTALHRILKALRPFCDFLDEWGLSLQTVRPEHMNEFLMSDRMRDRAPGYKMLTVRAVRALWSHRKFLTDTITFKPWGARPNKQVAGFVSKPKAENKTPRIPEEIAGPLLSWALFYVEVASADLLQATQRWRELTSHAEESPSRAEERRRVMAWVHGQVAQGIALPMSFPRTDRSSSQKDGLNRRMIFAHAGVRPLFLQIQEWQRILGPFEEYGAPGDLGIPLKIDPKTGRPWREALDQPELDYERLYLQMACMIVILFLTGMRVMEAASLKRGCASTSTTVADRFRYKVQGVTFKNNARPTGKRAVWVTVEPVHRAIQILEQMHDDPFLFPDEGRGGSTHLTTNKINLRLKDFCHWVNANHAGPDRLPIPTSHQGVPFSLTSGTFRRTLAWYIAAKPFGIVAGGIQFQHLSKRMFEGYAGTSDSGFKQELEAEEDLRRRRDIIEIYESELAGETSTGPASDRINRELGRVHEAISTYPGTVVDERRRHKMLNHVTRTLHKGPLTDCFFDPATALCRKSNPGTMPAFELCQPTKCANSRISREHEGPWLARQDAANDLLSGGKLSMPERDAVLPLALEAEGVLKALGSKGVS